MAANTKSRTRRSGIPHVSLFRRSGRRKWYAHVYCDDLNIDYHKSVCVDRSIASEWAVKTSNEITRLRLGICTPQELRRASQRHTPAFDLLDTFTESRRTPAITSKEVDQVDSRCRKLLTAMEATCLDDLDADRVALAIAALHDEGRSVATCNHYLKALKRFCIYLERKAGFHNEIRWVKPYNAETGIVHPRRAPSINEVDQLLESAQLGVPYIWNGREISAEDREMAYLLASKSGLRYSELRFLRPEHFRIGQIDAPLFSDNPAPPAVVVEAGTSKHRKKDLQPIPEDVAARFASFIKGKPRGKPIWDLPDKAYLMLQFDQGNASPPIEYKSDSGYFDFHSLRHFYGTELGSREKNIKVVQTLMRHSDVRLTLRYMHVTMHNEVAAIESLPRFRARAKKATNRQMMLFDSGAATAATTRSA